MCGLLPFANDFLLAQRCLEGDERALIGFRGRYLPLLATYFRQRGALEKKANHLADSLWADLLLERPGRRQRLATYDGRTSLNSWLRVLATNYLKGDDDS
jgi:hypothetical protein